MTARQTSLGGQRAAEVRRLLVRLDLPAIGTLGIAEVAKLELSYTEVPAMVQHTVTIPVAVNVVPGDQAAGRVPNPEVLREALLLESQKAKRASMDALARGDVQSAGRRLDSAISAWEDATGLANEESAAEVDWLAETRDRLERGDRAYSQKRLQSDHTRKVRGYKSRSQGGEKTSDENGSGERGKQG